VGGEAGASESSGSSSSTEASYAARAARREKERSIALREEEEEEAAAIAARVQAAYQAQRASAVAGTAREMVAKGPRAGTSTAIEVEKEEEEGEKEGGEEEEEEEEEEGAFIREEGAWAAEAMPEEVGEILSSLGLRKCARSTLPTRMPTLLQEADVALAEYKARLEGLQREVEAGLDPVRRGGHRDVREIEAVCQACAEGLERLHRVMVRFTRHTDDVLNWCLKRMRGREAEAWEGRVDAFIASHAGVDRACKTFMKRTKEELLEVEVGGRVVWEDVWEEETEEETGKEEGGDGRWRPEGRGGEWGCGQGRIEGGPGRERKADRLQGSRRVVGDKRGGQRRKNGRGRRLGGFGPGSEREGSVGREGPEEPGRGGSRKKRRRRDAKPTRNGGNVTGKEGTADDFEESSTEALAPSPTRRGCGDERKATSKVQAQREAGRQRQRRKRGREERARKQDAWSPFSESGEGEDEWEGGSEDGWWTSDSGGNRRDAGRGYGQWAMMDMEASKAAEGMGEDIEVALSRQGHCAWGSVSVPTVVARVLDEAVMGREANMEGLEESERGVVSVFDTLRLRVHGSWLNEPRPLLTELVIPRLRRHFEELTVGWTRGQGGREDGEEGEGPSLLTLQTGLRAISAHLRDYGGRYSTGERKTFGRVLFRHAYQMDRDFCPGGLLGEETKGTSLAACRRQRQQGCMAATLYWYLLDWSSVLVQQAAKAFSTSPRTSEREDNEHQLEVASILTPAGELLLFVLCQLVTLHLRTPSTLALQLDVSPAGIFRPLLNSIPFSDSSSPSLCSLWLQTYNHAKIIALAQTNLACSRGGTASATRPLGFWSWLLHILRGRPHLNHYIYTAPALRESLIRHDLEEHVRVAGRSNNELPPGNMTNGSKPVEGRNPRRAKDEEWNETPLQQDLGTIEGMWRLVFESVRLELLAEKIDGMSGRQRTTEGGAREHFSCWALVEYMIAASDNLNLLSQHRQVLDGGLSSDQEVMGRHRYLALLVRRLRTLLKVWQPDGDLIARLWLSLLQTSATRLKDASPPNPTLSALPLVKTLVRTCCRQAALADGTPGTSPDTTPLWGRDWSIPRSLLWDLADPRYCALPSYLVLPPPAFLRDLAFGDAVRRLVSRGSDELLLLASCLLERHMSMLKDAGARRDFLVSLLPRLETMTSFSPSIGNRERYASSSRSLELAEMAAGAKGRGDGMGGIRDDDMGNVAQNEAKRGQLLGLHNLALALLVLVDKGDAEQKVLLNFWRRLKHFTSSCSARGDGGVQNAEASLALSVQFLALIGPSTEENIDFLHYESLLDSLWQWFGVLGKMTTTAPRPMSSFTTSNIRINNFTGIQDVAAGNQRYSPVVLWSLLQGLAFAVQLSCTFPFPPSHVAKLLGTVEGLLTQYRELDDAALGLLLRMYRCVCPLRKVTLLRDVSVIPLFEKVPLFASLVKGARNHTFDSGTLLVSTSCNRGGENGREEQEIFASQMSAPSTDLLQALGRLTKECWEVGGGNDNAMDPSPVPSTAPYLMSASRRVHKHLHSLPALQALAAAHALTHAKGLKAPDFPLLRASLESGTATYCDRQTKFLRFLAPCYYNAYLAYDLPCFPSLEGREYPVLAAWIGLTLEGASWVEAGGAALISTMNIMGRADVDLGNGGMSDIFPERYLMQWYWPFTIRLFTVFKSSSSDSTANRGPAFPPPGDTVASRLLNLEENFRSYIHIPTSKELSYLKTRSRGHFLSERPLFEHDLLGRLLLLSNVAIAVAPISSPQQSTQVRNARKQQILRLLAHVGAATRLLASARAVKTNSSTPNLILALRPSHLLAYAFASLLFRFAADVIQEKLLDELIASLFSGLFLPGQIWHPSSTICTRDPISLPTTTLSPCPTLTNPILAALYAGDAIRCLAQIRFGREAVVQWLRYLVQEGMINFGGEKTWRRAIDGDKDGESDDLSDQGRCQARLLTSLAHGLWHASPFDFLHGPAINNWKMETRDEITLKGLQNLMGNILSLRPPSVNDPHHPSGSCQLEVTHIQAKLPYFRWQFLLDLDIGPTLRAAFAADLTCTENRRVIDKAEVLLRFLCFFVDSPSCTAEGVVDENIGACSSQDLFPIMLPVLEALLRANWREKGKTGGAGGKLFLPALRVAFAVLRCPLAIDSERAANFTPFTAATPTLWHWAMRSKLGGSGDSGTDIGRDVDVGCQDACHRNIALQRFAGLWGCLVGLLAVSPEYMSGLEIQAPSYSQLHLITEEMWRLTAESHSIFAAVRAKNIYTLSRHVWGGQEWHGKFSEGNSLLNFTCGDKIRTRTLEETKICEQLREFLCTGVDENGKDSLADEGSAESNVTTWKKVRPWILGFRNRDGAP